MSNSLNKENEPDDECAVNLNFDKSPDSDDVFNKLKSIRLNNIDRIVIANLNINSISNKFEQLKYIIKGNIDILVITETKTDESHQGFYIDGFNKPFRMDRNAHGGGVMIFVRDDIPCKQLKRHTFPGDIEGIFVEINLRKIKWLLFGSYHPPSQNDSYFFDCVAKGLDLYYPNYDKFLLVGDFNAQDTEPILCNFMNQYDAKNLVKDKTCFKNIENPSCVDLFITNSYRSFQNTKVLSTGLSDFHKMVITVLKIKFKKLPPKMISYRCYRNFNEDRFRYDLKMCIEVCTSYEAFESLFMNVLNKHAPMKSKYIRANEAPYMTRALKQAIMKRSRLEAKFYKTKSNIDKTIYKRHKNYVSRLYKTEKKHFYQNLDLGDFLDNKKFWKNVKPLFSNKDINHYKITLVHNNEIITEDGVVAETLNSFFQDAVRSLDIQIDRHLLTNVTSGRPASDIDSIIECFSSHPSILKINEMVNPINFDFTTVSLQDIKDEIDNLNPKKAIPFGGIPIKMIINNKDILAEPIHSFVNSDINNGSFPNSLKLADITGIFKKDDATNAKNYRPVSVLPAISKIYERVIQKQLLQYVDIHLSKYLCGYRKGYNAQYALVSLLEKWRDILDKNGYAGGVLMDLSKAFDTLDHGLLLAKLHAYGMNKKSLELMRNYLSNRWQRTKVNTSFSSWSKLSLGVPQGSVLGPLLFNIYLNDLFWFNEQTEPCNFADDTTNYACDMEIKEVIRRLEHDSLIAIEWFESNNMKLNQEKCHLLIAGYRHQLHHANIGSNIIWESPGQKLLGVYIDKNIRLNDHVSNLCKMANQKLSALMRLGRFYNLEQRRLLMKSFVKSQFAYSPLVWMFHDRGSNNKINRVHERALRFVYKDDRHTFEELLIRDNSVTIHHRNIHAVAIEMFKSLNNVQIDLIDDIFIKNNDLNIIQTRSRNDFL